MFNTEFNTAVPRKSVQAKPLKETGVDKTAIYGVLSRYLGNVEELPTLLLTLIGNRIKLVDCYRFDDLERPLRAISSLFYTQYHIFLSLLFKRE